MILEVEDQQRQEKLWAPFKVTLDNTTTFPVQIPGAAYLATALMNWTAKNSIDIASIQGVCYIQFYNGIPLAAEIISYGDRLWEYVINLKNENLTENIILPG